MELIKSAYKGDYRFDVDIMKNTLLHNQVPEEWKGYYSTKPLKEWVADLKNRVEFVREALSNMHNTKS